MQVLDIISVWIHRIIRFRPPKSPTSKAKGGVFFKITGNYGAICPHGLAAAAGTTTASWRKLVSESPKRAFRPTPDFPPQRACVATSRWGTCRKRVWTLRSSHLQVVGRTRSCKRAMYDSHQLIEAVGVKVWTIIPIYRFSHLTFHEKSSDYTANSDFSSMILDCLHSDLVSNLLYERDQVNPLI